ncbi:unnamed protein product [Diabrotica balteata]|uniref:L antigen family member 3 n=1 Tax=Diabrotica balteata TaxID=107213 RepID=A0A9N9SNA3_DIABA|nr:unnamed protein product [Diabrotica balteata]
MDKTDDYEIDLEVPFQSHRIAEIAYDVLRVDKEPARSGVTKVLRVEEDKLIAHFSATLPKQLRVAVTGFFEKLQLISETIELLGPPLSNEYNYY